jgi:hypothetical protein
MTKQTKEQELKDKIDFLNPDSGIHKGHWTYEDVCQAELKGRQEARKEIIASSKRRNNTNDSQK